MHAEILKTELVSLSVHFDLASDDYFYVTALDFCFICKRFIVSVHKLLLQSSFFSGFASLSAPGSEADDDGKK